MIGKSVGTIVEHHKQTDYIFRLERRLCQLEKVVSNYVERFGMTEQARKAMLNCACSSKESVTRDPF